MFEEILWKFITQLNNVKKIQFQHTISYASHTIQSLTKSFSISDNERNNNIISLAKAMKYQTYWLSNQGIVGKHDSKISAIGKSADYSHFFIKRYF